MLRSYTYNALSAWFHLVIPALFPFMFLSNCLLFSGRYKMLLKGPGKLLAKMYQISPKHTYIILVGFLFGFPMGAKTIGQMCEMKELSKEDGSCLLAFCNQLSPIFMLTVIYPMLQTDALQKVYYLILFFTVPLLYGFVMCRMRHQKETTIRNGDANHEIKTQFEKPMVTITYIVDRSLKDALVSIANIGGYMLLAGCIAGFTQYFFLPQEFYDYIYPLIEITSGLSLVQPKGILPILYCTIGGLSCIFQTKCVLNTVTINLFPYVLHKMLQCIIIYLLSGCYL